MTDIRKIARPIVIAAMLVASIGMVGTAPVSEDLDATLVQIDLETVLAAGCTWACESCGEGKHRIVKAVWSNADSYHLEGCNNGGCHLHECDGARDRSSALQEASRLETAIAGSSRAEVAAFLAANQGRAVLNHERKALQLVGCDGRIVANYVSETSEALTALLQ